MVYWFMRGFGGGVGVMVVYWFRAKEVDQSHW